MFPTLQIAVRGLDPTLLYSLSVDFRPLDNKRYRYSFHQSKWTVAGTGDPELPPRVHVHGESPAPGAHWVRQLISFEKLKLTNNQMDSNGHVSGLNKRRRKDPRKKRDGFFLCLIVIPLKRYVYSSRTSFFYRVSLVRDSTSVSRICTLFHLCVIDVEQSRTGEM